MRALWMLTFCLAGVLLGQSESEFTQCTMQLNSDLNRASAATDKKIQQSLNCDAYTKQMKCVQNLLSTAGDMKDRTMQEIDRITKNKEDACGRAATPQVAIWLLLLLLLPACAPLLRSNSFF